jgi:rod shape-determining protein MreB and related proteins
MSHLLGVDFGSENIKICSMALNRIINEKNVIASDEDENWYGNQAYQMYDRVSDRYHITFPIRKGLVAAYPEALQLLCFYLDSFYKGGRDSLLNISLPAELSHVERKAYFELLSQIGVSSKNIRITDKAIAAAAGMGASILESHGIFLVDMGAQTTEVSIISDGNLIISRLLPYGSDDMQKRIGKLVKTEKNCIIGRKSSFEILKELGHAYKDNKLDRNQKMSMTGINAVSGYPEKFTLRSDLVTDAISDIPEKICSELKAVYERIPYDIAREISQNGIYLTGGASKLDRMNDLISSRLALKCIENDTPMENTARGLVKLISDDTLLKLTYDISGINR